MILLLKAYTFQSLDQSTDERPPHKKRKIITSPSLEEFVVSPSTKEAPEDPRVDGRSVKHPQWLAPSPDLDLPYRRPSPDSP